ncbi:HXXXD-type acyl-transferase family protein [Hibiscus syriacus]|uniref:HXXXD-type acyl-transferase family protein n=1 Tax=Hibiscus syriacus TaxID=106335 RepID=A0A6A3A088_HIBSY|nr:HXXXD-type acyl-transferase family protein [Hibiscus syriacus]
MGGVRCISTTLVKASAHNGGNGRIELTPWDLRLLLLGPIQKGLLFPKPKPSNAFLHRLKASLSTTLHHFPPLAGRLATIKLDDETVSFFIDCNNVGALFIHAKADGVTVSNIVESVYVPSIVHSFFPLNGMTNYDGIFEPLLGVQVTELADGIFIGVTINHSVVDGISFWHFINSWSEISRAYLLKQIHDGDQLTQPPLRERVFHFSKQSIAKLKEKANTEAGTNNISSLQALTSHLWRSIMRNRRLSSEEEMSYYLVWVGARPRLSNILLRKTTIG